MKKYDSNEFNLSEYAVFADECPLWSAPFGLKLLDRIRYRTGITAVDIGSGTGFPLTEIALRLGRSGKVYGVDPWIEANQRAEMKAKYFRLTNLTIMNCHAEAIPLEDNSVDLITSNNGLNNVVDAGLVLAECRRILKSGGQFIMTMNLDKTMAEFYDQLSSVLSEEGMENEILSMHRHITRKRPPLDEMTNKIVNNGFIIRDIIHDKFSYRFSSGTAMLEHYFIRLAFMGSWMEFLPADKADSIMEKVEKRLNRIAETSGFLNLTIPFALIDALRE
jgi:arsenite methyltransferase